MSDPVHLAWGAFTAGIDYAAGPSGRCARCRQVRVLHPIADVISDNFTGWDYLDPTATGMCTPCAWAHTTMDLRREPVLIRAGVATWADWTELLTVLHAPFGADVCATVPLAGRKHLLPGVRWGQVATDDGPVTWDAAAASLTALLAECAASGAPEKALAYDAVPPMKTLSTASDPGALLATWQQLSAWSGTPHRRLLAKVAAAAYRGARP